MYRRNFIGFIPAIGAAPFVAKDIIKDGSLYLIKEPELIKPNQNKVTQLSLSEAKIQIVQDGSVIGEGYITSLEMRRDPIYGRVDYGWGKIFDLGPTEINVSGTLFSFNDLM